MFFFNKNFVLKKEPNKAYLENKNWILKSAEIMCENITEMGFWESEIIPEESLSCKKKWHV